jgi:DNA-directed RNA polymerase subunit H
MHVLQPKHSKITEKEAEELLNTLNISKAQLPKISSTDPGLPEGCVVGEIIKVQRKDEDDVFISHRVVI